MESGRGEVRKLASGEGWVLILVWVLMGHSEHCGFFPEMRAQRKP